jgi:hypothetical protein
MAMKKSFATILAFATALLAQTPGGSVEGRILNSATGAGVGGVGIRLLDRQRTVLTATTDDTGAFRIGGLKDGQYDLSYQKDGYLHSSGDDREVQIRISGSDPLRFSAEMATFPTLRGRVLDAEGKPAVGVTVQLGASLQALQAQTGADGSFAFLKLSPGFFTLVARPNPPRAETKASPDQDRVEVVPTYYPSVIDSVQAEAIQVRGGMDLSGYDIRLRTAPVQRVRGTVLDIDGKPVPKAPVSLLIPASAPPFLMRGPLGLPGLFQPGLIEQTLQTSADGSFEFPSVRRGEWQIRAQSALGIDPQKLRQSPPLSASTPVSVGTRDVDRVEVRFAERFALNVSADFGSAKPLANMQPSVQLIPLDGQLMGPIGGPQTPQTMSASPGRAILMVQSAPAGYYPAAVLVGGRDMQGQVVDLIGPQPIQVVYKSDGGSVRGTVENGSGLTVALIPQERSGIKIGVSARCGSDGSFSMADVPPGDYYAGAFRDSTGMATAAFQNFLAVNGVRVRVEAGSASSLELRAARWP